MVSGLYNLASVSKYGTNFARVLYALPRMIGNRVLVVKGPMPLECKEFGDEIVNYAVLHYNQAGYYLAAMRTPSTRPIEFNSWGALK